MLTIHFGDSPDIVGRTVRYFDEAYATSTDYNYLQDEFIGRVIKDIDNSETTNGPAIMSPVLGCIPPQMLSGGVKTLICIYLEPEEKFNATFCGNNCAKWLLEIAKDRDIKIGLNYSMNFGKDFKIKCDNSGNIMTSMSDLVIEKDEAMRIEV